MNSTETPHNNIFLLEKKKMWLLEVLSSLDFHYEVNRYTFLGSNCTILFLSSLLSGVQNLMEKKMLLSKQIFVQRVDWFWYSQEPNRKS